MPGSSDLQDKVLSTIREQTQPLLTNARQDLAVRLEVMGFEDGLSRVLMIENHLQHMSRLNIHFPSSW